MRLNRGRDQGLNRGYGLDQRCGLTKESGFTLLEVILALFISGIFLSLALRLLMDQWRGAPRLKNHLEAQYAVMTAGQTVSNVIRSAQTVEWINETGTLKVLPLPSDENLLPTVDLYSVSDKDHDGINDLYWTHKGIPEPMASFMTRWTCTEVEPGLWEVFLEARVEGQKVTWRSIIRQRIY